MAEEMTMIHVTYGPYKDQRLSVTREEADRAIREGWAHNADEPRPDSPVEQTAEDRERIYADAHAGAARLRGEKPAEPTEPEPKQETPRPPEPKPRDMVAEEPKPPYRTRDIPPRK